MYGTTQRTLSVSTLVSHVIPVGVHEGGTPTLVWVFRVYGAAIVNNPLEGERELARCPGIGTANCHATYWQLVHFKVTNALITKDYKDLFVYGDVLKHNIQWLVCIGGMVQRWNKSLWLDNRSHVTLNIQSGGFTLALQSYPTLTFI